MGSMNDGETFGAWLSQYLDFERQPRKGVFWLDTMRFLCGRLGNPQDACPAFHVAGSKGKGSVSAMIAGILDAAGIRAGLYTSPHVSRFEERVGLAGRELAPGIYSRAAGLLEEAVAAIPEGELPGGRRPTWFELVTAFAMLCFREAGCGWAVYEVGLGGRLDATNVIAPRCCCITPVELEHTEYLGDTLAQVAAEKGGIIKAGVPVVLAPQQAEAREVLLRIARERGAEAVSVEDVAQVDGVAYRGEPGGGAVVMEASISSPLFRRPLRPALRLLGNFQAWNAATAAAAVRTALPQVGEDAIERGLAAACLPGRFEVVPPPPGYGGIPALVLDGAHTVNSVRLTAETFLRLLRRGAGPRLLFACAADKDAEHIAPLFRGWQVTLTRPGAAKQSDLPRLERAFAGAGIPYTCEPDCQTALRTALEGAAHGGEPLLVAGSFYLVAEVKAALRAAG